MNKRCNWIMPSKGWKDCGRPATYYADAIGGYYCDAHSITLRRAWWTSVVKIRKKKVKP
jgi:hypothetical protein